MSGLTSLAKDRALTHLFAKGCRVALARNGRPIQDAGYRDLPVSLTPPRPGAGEARVMQNQSDLRFGPWQEDAEAIDGWMVLDESGDVLVSNDLPRAEQPRRGDELVLYQADLIIGLKG